MISVDRFCLNRKAAPGVSLADTIRFVAKAGLQNIELRNDLYGAADNSTILDHLNGLDVKKLLGENDVSVETINAIGNMDKRDSIDENIASLTEMLEMSKDFNLKNIIFCPVRSNADSRSPQQRKSEAVQNVREYSKLLKKYQVNGLIEPLGFLDSTLRYPWEGQTVIEESSVDNFKLVADTFHYYLAGVTDEVFKQKIDPAYIGLVHLSAVTNNKSREQLDDQDRYMLSDNDVMHSARMANNIEKSGYKGLYAFEPFSDDLKKYSEEKAVTELLKSIKLVQNTN